MNRRRTLALAAGRFQHLRSKGAFWIELVRTWIMPGAAIGAYALYLGFPKWVSITAAVAGPVTIEVIGTLIAKFLYDHGGQEADYQMAYDKDPYKRESIEELRRMRMWLEMLEKGSGGDTITFSRIKNLTIPPAQIGRAHV